MNRIFRYLRLSDPANSELPNWQIFDFFKKVSQLLCHCPTQMASVPWVERLARSDVYVASGEDVSSTGAEAVAVAWTG